MKPNGDMETIEEVIIRISRKSGIDLKDRKIGLDIPE